MKKDKAWLIKRVENYIPLNDKTVGHVVDNILDIIHQLDEPEVLSQEWIYEYATEVTYDEILDQTETVYVDELENLIVPKQEEITEEQAWEVIEDKYDFSILQNVIGYVEKEGYTVLEKPTIPKSVADWIEEVKDKERTLYGAMSECPREVDYWLIDGDCSNQDTFARAWLYGYEVEKEKLYHIKFSENQYAQRFDESKINSILVNEKELAGRFTEEQIKKMNPALMALAVEVAE